MLLDQGCLLACAHLLAAHLLARMRCLLVCAHIYRRPHRHAACGYAVNVWARSFRPHRPHSHAALLLLYCIGHAALLLLYCIATQHLWPDTCTEGRMSGRMSYVLRAKGHTS